MTDEQAEPMETAPKDTRWILGFEPQEGLGVPEWQPMRWLPEKFFYHPTKGNEVVRQAGWYGDGFDRDRPVSPTHWTPLPASPATHTPNR